MAKQILMRSTAGLDVYFAQAPAAAPQVHKFPEATRSYRDSETGFIVIAQQDEATEHDEIMLAVYPLSAIVSIRRGSVVAFGETLRHQQTSPPELPPMELQHS